MQHSSFTQTFHNHKHLEINLLAAWIWHTVWHETAQGLCKYVLNSKGWKWRLASYLFPVLLCLDCSTYVNLQFKWHWFSCRLRSLTRQHGSQDSHWVGFEFSRLKQRFIYRHFHSSINIYKSVYSLSGKLLIHSTGRWFKAKVHHTSLLVANL